MVTECFKNEIHKHQSTIMCPYHFFSSLNVILHFNLLGFAYYCKESFTYLAMELGQIERENPAHLRLYSKNCSEFDLGAENRTYF